MRVANAVGTCTQAVMHVPVATVYAAAALASALSADCTVAIGGGSTIGLSKALSLRLDLPSLVVPTTYSGSEVPHLWGPTHDGVTTTERERTVLHTDVIYDTDLPMTQPA